MSLRTLLRLIGTLLSLTLLVYLLSQQGWDKIWAALKQIPLWVLGLALVLQLASRIAVSMRWYVLLRAVDVPITITQSLQITFAGLFANNFLPTTIGGDVVRLAGILRLKYDKVLSATSLVVDRLVGMAGMALVLPFGLIPWLATSPFSGSIMIIIPIQRWAKRLWSIVKSVWQALLLWLQHPWGLLFALFWTLVHMACLFGTIWLLLDGLGESVSFWLIAGLWSLVYFVTLIPISINGLGVQEVSMAYLFINVGGVSAHNGLILALILRTLIMAASLPGVFFLPDLLAGRRDDPDVEITLGT